MYFYKILVKMIIKNLLLILISVTLVTSYMVGVDFNTYSAN